MKSILITFIALFMFSPTFSQKNVVAEQRTAEFISYFNAGKTESLYALLADKLKSTLPLTSIRSVVFECYSTLSSLKPFSTRLKSPLVHMHFKVLIRSRAFSSV